ncbi:MAG: EAL domain-containing protein [Alkalimonas sp.]|nr:EAL domain-containing protein [Alkalimonas sp.]
MLDLYSKLTPGAFYLFVADAFGRYSLPAISKSVEDMMGYSAQELQNNPELIFDRMHPDDKKKVQDDIHQSKQQLTTFHCQYRMQHRDGRWIWLAAHSEPEEAAEQQTLWRGFLYDISEQKQFEQQLSKAADEAQQLLDHMMDAVISTDQQGVILSFNPAAEQLLGYHSTETIGQNIKLIMPPHHAEKHDRYLHNYQQHQAAKIIGNSRRLEARHKEGYAIPIELRVCEISSRHGKKFLGVLRDLTEQQEQHRVVQQLQQQDPLTQLPNRQAFLQQLAATTKSYSRSPVQYGLLLLDIDHFKRLNDTTSHGFGDQVLCELARRLKQLPSSMHHLARVGGDQFAIIWPLLTPDPAELLPQLASAAETILQRLATPIALSDASCTISVSIGICLLTDDMRHDQWLHFAESAMYHAKSQGRNTYEIFTPELEQQELSQAQLALDLRQAIDNNEFQLYLQGQFNQQGQLVGAEALLRWHHPKRGMIPPDIFIPLAEETEAILHIGRWVLDQAGQLLHHWQQDPSRRDVQLAINISSRQFSDTHFAQDVLNCLDKYNFPAEQLHLELTESLLIDNAVEVANTMMRLHSRGLTFSLDDFGTGYSSLNYLKRLPLQTLKIDRSFVRDLTTNPQDALIARSIVSLAHNLGLSVIAEGVETVEQLQTLNKMGCNCYQGYYFQQPLPLTEFEQAQPDMQQNGKSLATGNSQSFMA